MTACAPDDVDFVGSQQRDASSVGNAQEGDGGGAELDASLPGLDGGRPVVTPDSQDAAAEQQADAQVSGEDGSPLDPDDHRTKQVPAGTVKLGWAHRDLGAGANYDGGDNAAVCPDPDAMVTKGTVKYENGTWTITGSGEGFIHGWDQGSLVYLEEPIQGDFTFSAKVEKLEMTDGKPLNGAAEALLNVRQDMGYKQPTHSLIAGAAPGKFIMMARFFWDGEHKWWHWPAWPETWPEHRNIPSWTKLEVRGKTIRVFNSYDGTGWQEINDNDAARTWTPFNLKDMPDARYAGLVCSARNDRNYAPLVRLSGKNLDCRDPNSPALTAAARCVFSNVRITTP